MPDLTIYLGYAKYPSAARTYLYQVPSPRKDEVTCDNIEIEAAITLAQAVELDDTAKASFPNTNLVKHETGFTYQDTKVRVYKPPVFSCLYIEKKVKYNYTGMKFSLWSEPDYIIERLVPMQTDRVVVCIGYKHYFVK